ncbi:hypothetical protein B1R32_10387 [Abditibacterium utsteinense]|uniref:SMI1-KNR4 cell-wall n=1 Tax=Abditibacterium utsteinense TaxID=1960156 RepID=A0A2S8SVK7_9BACT|nr:SMI1/KNR4 family protein [Abditibacterium utsteinense]PQV64820.1 hypothetical protein B1R32_10387 [Abditibacterium utsteinense]
MSKHFFDPIKRELEKVSALGDEVSANGTRLIGHAPHVAPLAYFHQIFPSLNTKEISWLAQHFPRDLPTDLKDFFLLANGIDVFIGALSIFGLRRNYIRTVEESRQPFSIVIPNTFERPSNLSLDLLIIGYSSTDGSHYVINSVSNKVSRLHQRSFRQIAGWENLWVMLLEEITRLQKEFESGKGKAAQ